MRDEDKILAAARELRQCFGCAYGLCCCASVVLAAMLRKKGLEPRVVKGHFSTDLPAEGDYGEEHGNGGDRLHYWIQCSGFLVDITADQFNGELDGKEMPEIVLSPLRKAHWRYGPRRYGPRHGNSVGKAVKPRVSLLDAMWRIKDGTGLQEGVPLAFGILRVQNPDYSEAVRALESLGLPFRKSKGQLKLREERIRLA